MNTYGEAVVGYRFWNTHPDADVLRSVFRVRSWETGVNTAECLSNMSRCVAPAEGCQCGINSFYLLPQESADNLYKILPEYVQGLILGAGSVRLHEGGWRAEQAKIYALYCPDFLPDSNKKKIHAIAREYEVPVLSDYSELETAADSLGVVYRNKEAVQKALEDQFADFFAPNKRFRIARIRFRKAIANLKPADH